MLMIRKLMKYDLLSLFKSCSIMYICGAFVVLSTGLLTILYKAMGEGRSTVSKFLPNAIDTAYYLSLSFAGFMSGVVVFGSCVLGFLHFSKSVFGREGYLTNTLPVTPHNILVAKITTMFIVYQVSSIFGGLMSSFTFWCLSSFEEVYLYFNLSSMIIGNFGEYGVGSVAFDIEFLSWLCIIAVITFAYMCMSIGQLFKHYVLATIAVALGIYHTLLIPYIAVTAIAFTVSASGFGIENFQHGHVLLLLAPSIFILIGIFYFVTYFNLKKKLNLV